MSTYINFYTVPEVGRLKCCCQCSNAQIVPNITLPLNIPYTCSNMKVKYKYLNINNVNKLDIQRIKFCPMVY